MSPKRQDRSDDWLGFSANSLNHVFPLPLSTQVVVTVDGTYSERWITAGSFTLLASSTVFVGGSEATYNLKGNNNWVGCLKKVRGWLSQG